ncbi:MAG: hypothetical protein ACR2G7_08840 [Acidimicrobiales bacterium]
MTPGPVLVALEALVDASGVVGPLEEAMPTGGRPRQLPVRSLVLGVLLDLGDDRPAHLSRVHQALVSLPPDDQTRLGVAVEGRHGSHTLS